MILDLLLLHIQRREVSVALASLTSNLRIDFLQSVSISKTNYTFPSLLNLIRGGGSRFLLSLTLLTRTILE